MRIEIIERNYQASQHLIDVVEKKIQKLDKYFETDNADCKVYFKKENTSLKLEIMLEYEGRLVRAQVISDNFYENIDQILPKLEGQIRKHRTRFDKQQKNNAFKERTLYQNDEEVEEQVDKYIADPYCGGVCSVSFFKNLTSAMAKMGRERYIKNISLNTPIYVHGGSMDPVSDMGKGLKKLYYQYVDLGVKDVKLDIYEGARHEIYNEINKDEVYKNTLEFINSHI